MGELSIGDVVFVNFPFSNLENSKLRPAVIIASAQNNDWILCQITSKPYADTKSIELNDIDFDQGTLKRVSYIRAGKIFTAHESIINKRVGNLKKTKQRLIVDAIIELISIA